MNNAPSHHQLSKPVGLKPSKIVYQAASLHNTCALLTALHSLCYFDLRALGNCVIFWSSFYFHGNLCLWVSILFYQDMGLELFSEVLEFSFDATEIKGRAVESTHAVCHRVRG